MYYQTKRILVCNDGLMGDDYEYFHHNTIFQPYSYYCYIKMFLLKHRNKEIKKTNYI